MLSSLPIAGDGNSVSCHCVYHVLSHRSDQLKYSTVMLVTITVLALCGCNIGKYSVGGTVTGLTGTGLVLANNGGDNLTVTANGSFSFGSGIGNGDVYAVSIVTQPSDPAQTCTVRNGSGTIAKAAITNIIVTCTQAGQFAYVANQSSNDISVFAIDSSTGTLSEIAGSPFAATGTTPVAIAVDPNGKYAYVANNVSDTLSVYSIDAASGVLTAVGSPVATHMAPVAVTVDPSDSYVFVANQASNDISAYSIDTSTGVPTEQFSPAPAS